ncbi:MAG: pyridoxamine 5'-phosphate oxidase family protein, partial [Bacteroidota bacterium]
MGKTLSQELELEFCKRKVSGSESTLLGSLATCEANGQPRVRTVVLHEISENRVTLVVSKFHKKWEQVQNNPRAELSIWWPDSLQQYRLTGDLQEASHELACQLWTQQSEGAK